MKSLFDLMSLTQRPFALFGDVCTNVNEPVAMASKYWDILHLSYAETHAKFSSADAKDQYPTFFRMIPGDRNLIAARCHLLLSYNWTRVGTIKQSDDPRYALVRSLFNKPVPRKKFSEGGSTHFFPKFSPNTPKKIFVFVGGADPPPPPPSPLDTSMLFEFIGIN